MENKRVANCGAWCATAQLEDGSWIAVPITCRSWDCPSCARYLKRRLLRRLRNSSPNLFITLTTSERTAPSPREAFDVANKAIGPLMKRWRRKFPNDRVEYFLVWEKTKRGWPHAHLLLSAPRVSRHWLSDQWRMLTRSYIVDLQLVSSIQHAAGYLTKYLAKDPQVPEGQRRWRRSKGFFTLPADDGSTPLPVRSKWEKQPRPAMSQAAFWLRNGLAVRLDDRGIISARDDPTEWASQIQRGLYEQIIRGLPAIHVPATDDHTWWASPL